MSYSHRYPPIRCHKTIEILDTQQKVKKTAYFLLKRNGSRTSPPRCLQSLPMEVPEVS
jgi:hypothetical protein